MEEIIPAESNVLPIKTDHKEMPVPAEGKRLYITRHSKGIDFHALLGQVVRKYGRDSGRDKSRNTVCGSDSR